MPDPSEVQAMRWMTLDTGDPEIRLTVRRARMRDEIGRLFELDLDLLTDEPDVRLDAMLGRPVTLRLIRPDGVARLVTGFVSRFSLVRGAPGVGEYRATVVPFLWFLTRQKTSRIFQHKTVREIVTEVLEKQYRYNVLDWKLSEKYQTHEYRVQYQESDFAFLSRLMEQEGFYFWIEHADGKHTTHFGDSPGPHDHEPGYESLPYRPAGDDSLGKWTERIVELEVTSDLVPTRFSHSDYDFKKPNTPLYSARDEVPPHAAGQLEVFEFPGEMVEVKESQRLSRVRLEEIAAGHLVMRGTTDAVGMTIGRTFGVSEHPTAEITAKKWMVTHLEWEATNNVPYSGKDQEPGFTCRFRAIPADIPYRTPRTTPRPIIAGPQSAVVTGPDPKPGSVREEIWTDEYGRVKVHFHWDHKGHTDENSSCWIRVSQLWAGQNFGSMFIPRVGQEVIVEFLEGDPDQPIITGRVYNRRNMPPHPLPATKDTSTIMSRSTKKGSQNNFNEIRFVDTKDQELFYEQAEKDRQVLVKHDNAETVGHNETVGIGNDRSKTVGGDETVAIVKNRTEVVGINETVAVKANRTVTVDVNETKAVKVRQSISVGGIRQVQVGKIENKTVGLLRTQFTGLAETVNAGLVENINGGLATIISAGLVLELKASGNTISMGPWGIKITGKKIVIKGDQVIINP